LNKFLNDNNNNNYNNYINNNNNNNIKNIINQKHNYLHLNKKIFETKSVEKNKSNEKLYKDGSNIFLSKNKSNNNINKCYNKINSSNFLLKNEKKNYQNKNIRKYKSTNKEKIINKKFSYLNSDNNLIINFNFNIIYVNIIYFIKLHYINLN